MATLIVAYTVNSYITIYERGPWSVQCPRFKPPPTRYTINNIAQYY